MANSTGRGHGGAGSKSGYPRDPGATGNGTTEYKEVSWINDQFLKASSSLKDVSDYSAQNVNQNLGNIVANTNKVSKSSELTFSHHKNAFNGKATGTEVWYYLGDVKGKQLAEKLSAAIAKELGIPNRGAKATTDLYVVRNTYATCLLFEWCFVDNSNDMKQFNENKVAAVNAALEILDYKKLGGTTAVTPPKRKTPQGDWIKEDKKVKITKKNEKIWSNFDWKFRTNTNDVLNKEYNVTGKYNHENGYTYYSLYDNKGGWHGYINEGFVTEVNYDINKGDKVKLHNFASKYQTGQSIPGWVKKGTYTVIKKEKLTKKQSKSTYKYLLSNINSWVLGQDIYKA